MGPKELNSRNFKKLISRWPGVEAEYDEYENEIREIQNNIFEAGNHQSISRNSIRAHLGNIALPIGYSWTCFAPSGSNMAQPSNANRQLTK